MMDVLRRFELFVHVSIDAVVRGWDSDVVSLAELVLLAGALCVPGAILLLIVHSACYGGARKRCFASCAVPATLILAALLRGFAANRCGSLRLDVPVNASYPLHWPWIGAPPTTLDQLTLVPRVEGDSDVDWAEIRQTALPLVLQGAVRAEASSGDWEPGKVAERLRHIGAHEQVFLQRGNPEQQTFEDVPCQLTDFLDRINDDTWLHQFNSALPYLAETEVAVLQGVQRALRKLLPPGHVSCEDAPSGPGRIATLQTLWWIGPRGARTGLHSDPYPINVLYTLHGTKTMWLFPPSNASAMYQEEKFDYGGVCSAVDPFNPDLETHPLFSSAVPIAAHLAAGDALFVPPGWFHFAEAHSASISFTGRAFTTCEFLSLWDVLLTGSLKHVGLANVVGIDSIDNRSAFSQRESNICGGSHY